MSCNPALDTGALSLARGLRRNESLLRLSIKSCVLKTTGAAYLLTAQRGHFPLINLDLGQNYANEDLGARYNWLENELGPLVTSLERSPSCLRILDLGMTLVALSELAFEITNVESLVVFNAKNAYGKVHPELKVKVNERVEESIKRLYGGMTVATFDAEENRRLTALNDVWLIDSASHNHDAGLTSRGMSQLKKVWEDHLETVDQVYDQNTWMTSYRHPYLHFLNVVVKGERYWHIHLPIAFVFGSVRFEPGVLARFSAKMHLMVSTLTFACSNIVLLN